MGDGERLDLEKIRRISRAALALSAVAALLGHASAQSQPTRETGTYALSFVRGTGAEGCPSRQDLEREVSTRLGHSPFDSGAPKSIEILTEGTPAGFRSVVTVLDRDGKVLGRRVLLGDEPSCAPIFSATALAVALLIDPEAALSRDARANEAVGRFEVEAPPPPPIAPPPSILPVAPPSPAPPPPQNRAPSAPPAPPAREAHGVLLGADAAVTAGLVPEVSPGVGIFANGRLGPRFGLSLSALYVFKAEASDDNAAVLDISLTSFGAALTISAVDTGAFELVPDAGLMAGALHAAVREGEVIDSGDQAFFALGFGLRAQVRVVTGFYLAVRAGGAVPLVRRGLFVREADEPIWRQPPVSGLASFGVGWAFF
jgi:hypothetical protein